MELKHCKPKTPVHVYAATRGEPIEGAGRVIAVHEGGRGPRVEVYIPDLGKHVRVRPSQLQRA